MLLFAALVVASVPQQLPKVADDAVENILAVDGVRGSIGTAWYLPPLLRHSFEVDPS